MADPISLSPELQAEYQQKAAQPAPINPLKDLDAQSLADLEVKDPDNFNVARAFSEQPGLHGDAALVQKVADANNLVKQRGFKLEDLPGPKKIGGQVWDVAKGVGKQLWNYASAAVAPVVGAAGELTGQNPDFQNQVEENAQRGVAENWAGTEQAVTGLAGMGARAVNKVFGKSAKDLTPQERVQDLFNDAGKHQQEKEIGRGHGAFMTPVGGEVIKGLEEAGKPIRPEESATLAAGDPFSLWAFGKVMQAGGALVPNAVKAGASAVAKGAGDVLANAAGDTLSKVASPVLKAGGTVAEKTGKVAEVVAPIVGAAKAIAEGEPSHLLEEGLGGKIAGHALEAIGSGAKKLAVGAKDLGEQISGKTPMVSPYAQAARDVLQAAPGAAGKVAEGAAIDIGTAAATSERPEETQGVGLGTALSLPGALKGVGHRVLSGQLVAPRSYGISTPQPASKNYPILAAMHNTAFNNAAPGVKARLNALRQFANGAAPGTDIFYGDSDKSIEKALLASGLSPEQAQDFSGHEGFFTTALPGADGQTHRVIIVKNVSAAPHEVFHGIQDVLGEEANQKIDHIVRESYGDQWDYEGQRYAKRMNNNQSVQDWRETVLDKSGWGVNAAKEKISQAVGGDAEKVKGLWGQLMDRALANNPHLSPEKMQEQVWRDVLSPEEAQQTADKYLARELAAENFDVAFKHGLDAPAGLPQKLAAVAGKLVTALGGNPIAGRKSEIGNIEPKGPVLEAVKGTVEGKTAPIVEPVAGEKSSTPPNADKVIQKAKDYVANNPTGEADKDAAANDILAAAEQHKGVRLTYWGAPDAGGTGGQVTSIRPERRAEIEKARGAANKDLTLVEKEFFPYKVEMRSNGPQFVGWSPDNFEANVQKLSEWLGQMSRNSKALPNIPYDFDAATGRFTAKGRKELLADAQRAMDNQMKGFTGSGKPIVMPKETAERGFFAPEKTGTAAPLDQERADIINYLFHAQIPDTTSRVAPLHLAGQDVSAATMPGRLVEPVRPRGEYTPQQLTKAGLEGQERGVREVNPFRQAVEQTAKDAGINRPSLIDVSQRLNIPKIEKSVPSLRQEPFGANTLTLSAGFQPRAEDPEAVHEAAFRSKVNGKIFAGAYHGEAMMKAVEAGEAIDDHEIDREGTKPGEWEDGFTTNNGKFLTREEAFNRAQEKKQISADYPKQYPPYGRGEKTANKLESVTFQEKRQFQPQTDAGRELQEKGFTFDFHLGSITLKKGSTEVGEMRVFQSPSQPHYGELESLYVSPEFRKQGIGEALLREGAKHLQQAGVTRVGGRFTNSISFKLAEKVLGGFDFVSDGVSDVPISEALKNLRNTPSESGPEGPSYEAGADIAGTQFQPSAEGATADDVAKMTPDEFVKWAQGLEGKGFTQVAYEVARDSSPEDVAKLAEHYEDFKGRADAAIKADDIQGAINLASQAQFFREAHEAATDTGSAKGQLAKMQAQPAPDKSENEFWLDRSGNFTPAPEGHLEAGHGLMPVGWKGTDVYGDLRKKGYHRVVVAPHDGTVYSEGNVLTPAQRRALESLSFDRKMPVTLNGRPSDIGTNLSGQAQPAPNLKEEEYRDIPGATVHRPYSTYAEASKAGQDNPWVRAGANPAENAEKSNTDRTLMVQFDSNIQSLGGKITRDEASAYYDKLYSGTRPGYSRMEDFWEIPQWMGFAAHILPKADMYVVRDVAQAKKFINEAKYGRVIFSAMDVNQAAIKELANGYDGKFDVGGYTAPGTFSDTPNVTWHNSLPDMAKAFGVPYSEGVDYRHYVGTDSIPRLTMSSGCKYQCAFCTIEKKVVAAPDALVTQQANAIAELGTKLVYLNDKTFGQAPNYQQLESLNTMMKSKNPNFEGFVVQTTASQMLKFPLDWLGKSGIKFVELGIESYNDPILRDIKKPATEAQMDASAKRMKELDITLIPNVLIGLPGETPETYARTLEYLKRHADIISHANIYNLAVYKEAELAKRITTASPGDYDENVREKSFYADPEVHRVFAGDLYKAGSEMLDRTPSTLVEPKQPLKITAQPKADDVSGRLRDMDELWPGIRFQAQPESESDETKKQGFLGYITEDKVVGKKDFGGGESHESRGLLVGSNDRWRYDPKKNAVVWSDDLPQVEYQDRVNDWLAKRGIVPARHVSLLDFSGQAQPQPEDEYPMDFDQGFNPHVVRNQDNVEKVDFGRKPAPEPAPSPRAANVPTHPGPLASNVPTPQKDEKESEKKDEESVDSGDGISHTQDMQDASTLSKMVTTPAQFSPKKFEPETIRAYHFSKASLWLTKTDPRRMTQGVHQFWGEVPKTFFFAQGSEDSAGPNFNDRAMYEAEFDRSKLYDPSKDKDPLDYFRVNRSEAERAVKKAGYSGVLVPIKGDKQVIISFEKTPVKFVANVDRAGVVKPGKIEDGRFIPHQAQPTMEPPTVFADPTFDDALKAVREGKSDGATFTPAGTPWKPDGKQDLVSLASVNVGLGELNREHVEAAIAPYRDLLDEPGVVAGIYAMSKDGKPSVSIDINAAVDQKHRANTVDFAKANDQEAIWDADKQEIVHTGGKGNTRLKSLGEVSDALSLLHRGEPVDVDEVIKQNAPDEGPREINLPGMGNRRVSNAELGNMTKAQIAEQYPEAVIPARRYEIIPSEIKNSPLFKQAGSEEEAVQSFSRKLIEFAREYRDNPIYKSGLKWYSDFVPLLKKKFGKNAQIMAELLAATSPQNDPEMNFAYALDALEQHKAGKFDPMIKKFLEGLKMAESEKKWMPWITKEIEAGRVPDAPATPTPATFMARWNEAHSLVPKQSNGKRYGISSGAVLRVLARKWLGSNTGLKTDNFLRNLLGTGNEATIDIWADRTMRRLGYSGSKAKWRILPKNAAPVTDADFLFAQKAYRHAAEQLGISPDALQGGLWFAEKELWDREGWSPLDLGDYRKEIKKMDLLKKGIAERARRLTEQGKTPAYHNVDLPIGVEPRNVRH